MFQKTPKNLLKASRPAVLNLFGVRDRFHRRQFSTGGPVGCFRQSFASRLLTPYWVRILTGRGLGTPALDSLLPVPEMPIPNLSARSRRTAVRLSLVFPWQRWSLSSMLSQTWSLVPTCITADMIMGLQ